MPNSQHSLFFLFLFLFLFFPFFFTPPLVHSRITPHSSKTTLLHVASSIQNTHKIFSKTTHPSSLNQQNLKSSSSSPLTLQLHSRASLLKPTHGDYKSLTLSRLERDSARVKSLLTRIDLALKRTSNTTKNNPTTFETAEKMKAPIISGTSEGSGEYFTRVGIGNPPSQSYMVLDTGSDVTWIQCSPCADCYQQSDPIFDPISSSSYSPIPCENPKCKTLDFSQCRILNNTCLYQVSYGDGSFTVGDFATETLTLGSASVAGIAIGCGHNNEGLFVGAAGLVGLGRGSLSLPSQLNSTQFSYCLVDRDSDSASTLEFDTPMPPTAVTAPIHRNREIDTFHYVGLTGISVGGEMLGVPAARFAVDAAGDGGVIVDSGTAVSRLGGDVYGLFREKFVRGTRGLTAAKGVGLFDTCYDLSGKTSVEVPTVSFHFPAGKELPLPAKNYLIPVDSVGTFCLAFAPTGSALSIIGNVQQQGTRVGFDLKNSVVGFSPNNC